MKIQYTTPYNFNIPLNQRSKSLDKNRNISFQGTPNFLKHDLIEHLTTIARAYEDISKSLARKTEKGIEVIEKECDFEYGRSMIFHNCGNSQNTILVNISDNKAERDLIKIIVKKGKSPADNKKFLNSFTISDYRKVLKDENPNQSYIFPKNIDYLSTEELKNNNVELNLQNTLNDLDFGMLKLRKFLNKINNQFLKPENYKFNNKVLQNWNEIDSSYSEVDKIIKSIPQKLSIKLRSDYGDYRLQAKQPTHILTNIGNEKCQIVYKKLDHATNGLLTRLLVYNDKNELINGFLVDKENQIVSNFNVKNFNVIPQKLTFHDQNSVQTILPELEKYLELYAEKLKDFKGFLKDKLKQRQTMPVVGKLQGKTLENLNNLSDIYAKLVNEFANYKGTALSDLKTSYPKWAAGGGQRGFIFRADNNEIISVVKVHNSLKNEFFRLCFNKDGETKYFLIDNDKIVKNFNPKYPQMFPKNVDYYDDIDIEQLGIEPYIEKALNEMSDFKNYFENPIKKIKSKNISSKTQTDNKTESVSEKINTSNLDEYRQIVKDCKIKFNKALNDAENNLESFNSTLAEIQQAINDFFKNRK